MTKQEVIKNAYVELIGDENYQIIKESIVDGVCMLIEHNVLRAKTLQELGFQRNDDRIVWWMEDTEGYFMPKSLEGLENNNGWIKIESDDDLPKEDGRCEFIKDTGKQLYGRFENRMGGLFVDESRRFEHPECRTESVTHWKPIYTSDGPIY